MAISSSVTWHLGIGSFALGIACLGLVKLCDAMTHSDFRRQGIWEDVSKAVISGAGQSKFMPVYATPHRYRASYKGFTLKLGMAHFFDIWRFALPLAPMSPMFTNPHLKRIALLGYYVYSGIRCVWRKLMLRPKQRIAVKREAVFDGWADELREIERQRNEAGVVKDASYLNWRFCANPDDYIIYKAHDKTGKPLGMLVTKIQAKDDKSVFGFIADAVVPSRCRGVLHRLLYEAELDFIKRSVILVDAWSTIHPFFFEGLLTYGYVPVKRTPFVIPVSQAVELRKRGWANSKKWVFHMADSDNV